MQYMAENLFCDEPNCGQPAQAFGFVKGVKWRTCDTHSMPLVRKGVTVYDIASFAFIQTPKDGPFYEDRRELQQKGLGSLAALESRCEDDWQKGQRCISETSETLQEAVRKSMQEIQQRSQQHYDEVKQVLGKLRSRFERLTQDKGFQLSPVDLEMCESVATGPVLCLMLEDSRLDVVEALFANFHVLTWEVGVKSQREWGGLLLTLAQNQANKKHWKCASEAAEYAKRLGVEGPDYMEAAVQCSENLTKQLSVLLSNKHYQAEGYLKAGQVASQVGNFDQSIEKLQRCIDLLGDMKDSKLHLRARSSLAETYYQAGRWADTVALCEEIVNSWNNIPYDFEFLRFLYFLSNSHYWLNHDNQGFALVNKWEGKITEENPPCKSLLLCIKANKLRLQGKSEDAKQLYEQALQLEESATYIVICCKGYFAEVQRSLGNLQEAEKAYLEASQLFSVHFPHSQGYAGCLLSMGNLYQSIKKPQSAEEEYMHAIKLYSHFPPTQSHAKCLTSLGLLYSTNKQHESALQSYLQARSIHSSRFPKSLDYAMCLAALGSVYMDMSRTNEGEEAYQKAVDVYSANFPRSRGHADCLYDLGVLCEKKGRKGAAVQKYEAARKIYTEGNLGSPGDAYICDSAIRRLISH